MSFEVLSERLKALQESNAQLKTLIDRLANIKFQPGSVPLDDDDENVMSELSSEIQQTLRDQEEDFESLQEDVEWLDKGRPGSEMEQQKSGVENAVKRAMKELQTYQTAFRKAQLSARRNLQAAQRQERELLLQSFIEPRSSNTSSPGPLEQQQQRQRRAYQTKELTKEEKELNASSDVTLALRRTHDMMASELSRSQFAHDTLRESNAALEALSESYSTLDTMLSSSRNLLGTLLRSQKSDTWYLETAFYVLAATIAWLVWRRLLYGPTWWLVWFPMKMFIKGWMGVFVAMGLGGGAASDGGDVAVNVSASLAAAAAAAAAAASSIAGTVASSAVHSKATRGPKVPGAKPPKVNVGGGGRGAPMKGPNVPGMQQRGDSESITEQVGEIIDGSKEGEHVGDDTLTAGSEGGSPPNPKKRMWEEDVEASKEAQRHKDEL